MLIYRNVKEGTFVLTDQEERVIQEAHKLNFSGWIPNLDPEQDLYLDSFSLVNGIGYQSPNPQQILKSIEDPSIQNLSLYSPSGFSFRVSPEQIGLKWTFIIQDSPAIQLEKKAFLAGPTVVCWAPNLKTAAALQLEGWEISKETWPLVPEVTKDKDGNEAKDALSSSDFCLSWSQSAWIRLGGAPTDYTYSEMNLYHHESSGLTGCQYFHFSYGETQNSRSNNRNDVYYDTIEITLNQAVQKSGAFLYTYPSQVQTRPHPGSSTTIGIFGPRPGAFRWKNQFYLNDPYLSKFPPLFQKIFEDQNPGRLITGLSEGWDFMLALEALGRNIPVTVIWTDVVEMGWNSRLIQLKEDIFQKSEVISVTNIRPYFQNIEGYFESADYEQLRLDQLRERDSLIVDQSEVIISGYPRDTNKTYYALEYAKQSGKPIAHYWEDL